MKVCKNCGRQTDDGKVRCPYCGYLFEENMDNILNKMKENLSSYKKEYTEPAAKAPQAPINPAPPQYTAPTDDSQRERAELLTQVAQLKDEVRALQGEIGRMQNTAAPGQQYVQPVPPQYVQMPAPMIVYPPAPQYVQAAPAMQANPVSAQPQEQPDTTKEESVTPSQSEETKSSVQEKDKKIKSKSDVQSDAGRGALSLLALVFLALSIGMFFLPWTTGKYEFSGFESLRNLFSNHAESEFVQFINKIVRPYAFTGGRTMADIARTICVYVLEFGIPVYFVSLLGGLLLILSLFGRVRMKAWHVLFAWISALCSAAVFIVFCWVEQFSQISMFFAIGAISDLLRAVVLIFFRGKRAEQKKLEKTKE